MDLLKKKILEEGKVIGTDILKVDSFLNHQIDVGLAQEMGKAFYERFKGRGINKILTVESSGIGLSCIAAQYFNNAKVVFGKKNKAKTQDNSCYEAEVYSYTRGVINQIRIAKKYLSKEDTVLILDDFMAMGGAANGLLSIAEQAGAKVAGIAICIEKGFQGGGDKLREQGYDLYSLAIVDSMDENKGIVFRD